MAIEMAGDSSSSPSVQPVVLREELRPPYYGKYYSESASRVFYTRYIEYKRHVEYANMGGAVKHQVATVGQLVPSHVQAVFARLEHGEMKISSTKLAAAIKEYAGHADDADVDLTEASAAVAKAVAMDKRGKTMLERVEPILSNLEALFAETPTFRKYIVIPRGHSIPGPPQ